MKYFFVLVFSFIVFTNTAKSEWDWNNLNVKCTGENSYSNFASDEDRCGFMHTNGGWWDEIARCTDGYHWSYLILNTSNESKGKTLLCGGVSAKDGFEEFPCVVFNGDLEKFKVIANTVKENTGENASTTSNCFKGFGQDIASDWSTLSAGQMLPKVKVQTPRERFCLFVKPNLLVKSKEQPGGCALLKEGWKEIATCPGHQWHWVLEKEDKRVVCKGIYALDGATEYPCTPFTADLEEFKKCTEAPH